MEGPLLMYHPDYTFHDIYDDPSEQFCDNNICQRTLLYIEIVCFRFRTIIINFLWRIGTFGELKWIKRDDVCYWFEEEARNNHLIYAWMIGSIETIWPDSSFSSDQLNDQINCKASDLTNDYIIWKLSDLIPHFPGLVSGVPSDSSSSLGVSEDRRWCWCWWWWWWWWWWWCW